MKRTWAVVLLFSAAVPAAAQTKGKWILGPAVSGVYPLDTDLASDISLGGFFKRRPKKGFSPALGLSWFSVDLRREGEQKLGKIRVRPFMAGIGYTLVKGRFSYGTSAVVGYSFNKVETTDEVIQNDNARFEVDNCFAAKVGANADYALGSRFVITTGVGLAFLEPKIRLTVTAPGQSPTQESGFWRAHSFLWQTGIGFAF